MNCAYLLDYQVVFCKVICVQLRPAAVESTRPSTEKARSLAEHRRREHRPSPHRVHAEDQECSSI